MTLYMYIRHTADTVSHTLVYDDAHRRGVIVKHNSYYSLHKGTNALHVSLCLSYNTGHELSLAQLNVTRAAQDSSTVRCSQSIMGASEYNNKKTDLLSTGASG